MVNHITRKLLRKRAEHNEGIISSLEEISLHQEELEGINEVLGMTCRKLKILYLQNNLIPKMENLHHLKDLEYLNLALNNITKIEGLQNCEFLNKLDLTVNFVDLDALEESITNLSQCHRLKDLYMMGNPAQTNWDKFNAYVIARIPQLKTLDGTEIIKSMRISASQQLPRMEAELKELAVKNRAEKEAIAAAKSQPKPPKSSSKAKDKQGTVIHRGDVVVEELGSDDEADLYEGPILDDHEDDDEEDDEELTENTPEARTEMYREIAEQKREKEKRESANHPKERDYEKEQAEAKEKVRKDEETKNPEEIAMRQKNEGGWNFYWDEETVRGSIRLEVCLPKHLDSSLIDVDVHPTYVSIVIKSKLLRLHLPAEVRSGDTKCQRSKTTGSLVLTMPKLNTKETTIFSKVDEQRKQNEKTASKTRGTAAKPSTTTRKPKKLSMQDQMLADAAAAKAKADGVVLEPGSGMAVDIRNIVPQKPKNDDPDAINLDIDLNSKSENESTSGNSLIHEID